MLSRSLWPPTLDRSTRGDRPYILHPLRVMMSLRTAEEMIVGVLHDVVEDCANLGYGWDRLRAEDLANGFLVR